MKNIVLLLIILTSCTQNDTKKELDFQTVFEKSEGLETATYDETISFYKNLSKEYSEISMDSIGETDSGYPLHIVTLNPEGEFNFNTIREQDKRILLINNGIHPGESDGIDATMMLYRDIVQGKIKTPEHTVLVTIPIYNIGGSLNRNTSTRTNQNGPISYGFRGNAQNYDLNRDFIKCDTKNAKAFAQLFHIIKPDVFIDNHVSNGADYQYTLTHLFTQHNKLGDRLGNYLQDEMMPHLEQNLLDKSWDITPYVNVFNQVPEAGFSQFMDYPRYSTGYATLFNTLGMMVETHMLKPYKQRVEGTYELMKSMIDVIEKDSDKIKALRENYFKIAHKNSTYPLDWVIDSSKTSTLKFKGFEGQMIPSKITGADRLYYDRSQPFTKNITYYNFFKPNTEVTIPNAYIIPKAWWKVIDLLKLNNVEMIPFKKDTTLTVESYKINTYDTRKQAYEGHYQHYNTTVVSQTKQVTCKKGDYFINTLQPAFRYLIETLEPQAPDSFFNWNFFDTILQQKEGFSPYVWEDKAQQLLSTNPKLQIDFNLRKSFDTDFANNWYAQLDCLHKQSEFYENAHLQYPVYRIK